MPRTALIIFSLIFAPLYVFTQSEGIDSLRAIIATAEKDSSLVKTYMNLVAELHNVDPDEAIKTCEAGIELSREINYYKGESYLLYIAGYTCNTVGEIKKAIRYIEQSKAVYTKLNDTTRLSLCYNLLGYCYGEIGENEKSLSNLFQSLKLAEEINDTITLIKSNSNLGVHYYDKGDLINARKYIKTAFDLGVLAEARKYLPQLYVNMSQVVEDPVLKSEYEKIALSLSDVDGSLPTSSYGSLHLLKGEFEESIVYFRKALKEAEILEDNYRLAHVSCRIAEAFYHIDELDSAQYYLPICIQFMEEQGTLMEVKRAYENFALVRKKKGDFKEAFADLQIAKSLGDTLYNQSITKQLAEADARYENQKKEAEITRQNLEIARQENLRNRIIFGGVLLLLVGSGIFQWYFNRQKRKKKEAENALELQQAEAEKLRELDQLKSRFFANISHELRTPLTLISAPLENALHGKMNPEIEKDISLAHSSSKKLLTMINEILDLSKLESGQLSLNESNANLQNLLRRIFYSFESFATLHDVELKFEYDLPESINISVDKAKFEDILNNLISNAIKFSDTGGQVTLMVKASGEDALISVIDNGKGIPKEELSKIFGRFYQASYEGTPLSGGTGIGLALAKELAQLFGGDIQVESEIGKGSIFTFRMPLKKVDEAVIESEIEVKEDVMVKGEMTSYEPILIQGERARILIVEDNRDMSEFLKRILSPYYHCTTAMNGVEGMKKIQTESFDLITSDVMMPGMDGFDFKEKVNSLPKLRHLPFIMLTARSRDVDKLIGLQLGVDDYITKPFNAKELLARIQNTLQNKVERDNWIRENEEIKETKNTEESAESQILKEAEQLVLSNLSDPQFNVSSLAKNIGYGERQLRRVIKKMTGFSPVRFILEIRLLKAYQFLVQRQFLSVSEVRNEVGIESSSYFSSKFTERFGKNPKEMLEE